MPEPTEDELENRRVSEPPGVRIPLPPPQNLSEEGVLVREASHKTHKLGAAGDGRLVSCDCLRGGDPSRARTLAPERRSPGSQAQVGD